MQKVIKHDLARDLLRPQLSNVLQSLLDTLEAYELEQIIGSLQEIIGMYDKEIIPYAVTLC